MEYTLKYDNIQIGINTIKQAYQMCKKSGIDADFQVTEYADNMKITIKIKKWRGDIWQR